ncbi:MAG: hypothetical protein K6U04_13095 [Armatimonadetes bacterium]|nr:hypothetical protein [Armatimonadota bacterium]
MLDANQRAVIFLNEIDRMLADDNREKRKARGGQFVGKKSPRMLVLPSHLEGRGPPWWRTAPPVVWVNIVTGEVYVNRWPLEENRRAGQEGRERYGRITARDRQT